MSRPANARWSPAPDPTFRLIPSRFPPIGLFDTVSTAADLEAVMELAGWTNDRLVHDRLLRLPQEQWVFGRPNASIVMASFLHAAPGGLRFNGPDLGAWYGAAALTTAIAEVGHHLRREALATGLPTLSRQFRAYQARLAGDFFDIRGQQAALPAIYASESYEAGQALGEELRSSRAAGLLFDSLRHMGGENAVAYDPLQILDVVQADHFEITVQADIRRIGARRLALS